MVLMSQVDPSTVTVTCFLSVPNDVPSTVISSPPFVDGEWVGIIFVIVGEEGVAVPLIVTKLLGAFVSPLIVSNDLQV